MLDLDQLQRLAEESAGVSENTGWWNKTVLYNLLGGARDECPPEDAAFIAAMSPDTAKKLIAVARAAQKWNRAWAAFAATQIGNFTPDLIPACEAADESLRTALEELK